MIIIKLMLKALLLVSVFAVCFHYVQKLDLDAIAYTIVPMGIYEVDLIDDDFLMQQEILD